MKDILLKLSLSLEKFWFSEKTFGFFTIFPPGMWIIMVLVIGVNIQYSNVLHITSLCLFGLASLITVVFGMIRELRKVKDKSE
jgi:hypothetical protein